MVEIPGLPDYLRRTLDEHDRVSKILRSHGQVFGTAYAAAMQFQADSNLGRLQEMLRSTALSSESLVAYQPLAWKLEAFAKQSPFAEAAFAKWLDGPIRNALGGVNNVDHIQRQVASATAGIAETLRQLSESVPLDFVQRLKGLQEFDSVRISRVSEIMRALTAESPAVSRLKTRIQELAEEGDSEEQVTETVRSVGRVRMEKASKDWVSYWSSPDFFFQLLSLLFAYYSNHSKYTPDDVMEALKKYHQEEMAVFQSVKPREQPKDLYIVLRATPLFSDRSARSPRIALALPGQFVRAIRFSKEWAYIEFFDEREELPRTGWMKKKNLNKPRHQPTD